jgi:hypothetical protein
MHLFCIKYATEQFVKMSRYSVVFSRVKHLCQVQEKLNTGWAISYLTKMHLNLLLVLSDLWPILYSRKATVDWRVWQQEASAMLTVTDFPQSHTKEQTTDERESSLSCRKNNVLRMQILNNVKYSPLLDS